MSYIIALAIAAGLGSARGEQPTRGTAPGLDTAQTKATPPVIVNFQGHLRQGATIINGTYSMTFRLYNAAVGGTLLQTMGPWNVNVSSGVFNVELPITQDYILNNTNLWVEVEIPSLGGIYTPRVKINSAAFAYNAYMSDSTQRIRNKGVTPEDLNMLAAAPNQAANFDLNANGRIDAALLDVYASGTDPGYIWNQDAVMQTPGRFWIQRQSTVGNPADTSSGGIFATLRPESGGSPFAAFQGQRGVIHGLAALAGGWYGGYFLSRTQAGNVGVYAWCDAANGQGVFAAGNTGTSIGVWGHGNVAGATGVFGSAGGVATYYTNVGVSGSAAAAGVAGYATNNPGGIGVYGTSPGTSGLGIAAAIYGAATNASAGVGVHGLGNNLASGRVPAAGAGVVGNGNTTGIIGYASSTSAPSWGVAGLGPNAEQWSLGGTRPFGVEGSVDGAGGIGVWGTMDTYGDNRLAVAGDNGASPAFLVGGSRVAIEGVADGSATGSFGVWGYAPTGAAGRVGVVGSAGRAPVYYNNWVGVVGCASTGGTGVASYVGKGGKGEWAGVFHGDVKVVDGESLKGSPQAGGNLYVSGVVASIAEVSPNTYVPMFGMTSTSGVKVYFDGQGRLKNGEAFIKIPEDIAKVIAGNAQVVVTPVGSWSGIYVAEIRSDGFLVKSGAGDPNAEFKWIAVAERKGYEDGKAQNFLAGLDLRPLEVKETEAITATRTPVESSTKTASAPELKTIKTTDQSPADPKKEVK